MERLSPSDRQLACEVLQSRYKACVKQSLVNDVLGAIDMDAPTRKCGHLFAELTAHCAELIRATSGKPVTPER
jgi:hypothetical protein